MKKSLVTFLTLASVLVMAKGYVDYNFNSNSFMNDNEIKVVTRLDDSTERYVASYDKYAADRLDFPVNAKNSASINKVWKIVGYTYNFGAPETKNHFLNFELVGSGKVMVAGDEELVYNMIKFSGNSITLIKETDGGSEIIDAVYVAQEEKEESVEVAQEEREEGVVGLKIEDDFQLVLTKVEHAKSEEAMSGNLSIRTNGEIISFDVDGNDLTTDGIKVGGIFNGEYNGELVSGKVSKNGGKGKFRVTFFSGTLRGLTLHFQDERDVESYEVVVLMDKKEKSMSAASAPAPRRELTEEQIADMNAQIEQNGFDFRN